MRSEALPCWLLVALLLGCEREPSFEGQRGARASEVRQAANRRDDTATAALRGSDSRVWKQARAGYPWRFPADHWAHSGYRTEWWYFTGHLDDAETGAPRFGYQVTFFKVGLAPTAADYDSAWSTESMVMGHFALSDLTTNKHYFSESVHRVAPGLAGIGEQPDPSIIWVKAPAGTPGRWELAWNGKGFDMKAASARHGFALELSTRAAKPLVFQGPDGLSRKGKEAAQASLYYSFTRLDTAGTVKVGGRRFAVRGQSWMDKEFGSSLLGDNQVGWDWFSLQLDTGEELMLYVLRNPEGGVDHASGTRVHPDGRVDYFDEEAWRIEVLDRWKSPSGGRYPVSWRIQVAGHSLSVKDAFEDQENRGTLISDLAYWEGAVVISDPESGSRIGRGFVEMTGYAIHQ